MEQAEQINPKDSSLPKYNELRNAGHDLAAAKNTDVNCHWSISPAWCYAMATLDRLQEERLCCLKKWMLGRIAAASRLGFSRFLLSIILLFLLSTRAESACVDDVLERVDKGILLMDSQEVYRVLDNREAAAFWLPLSEVTICDPLGGVGDKTVIYEIRNHDDNQVVQAMRER